MIGITISIFIMVTVLIAMPVYADDWGCYDPKPGHPTEAEKAQYIKEISPLVIEAERKYGTPAAAIGAMAIAESGYGWTRTALEAHNLFGWKFYSSSAAPGRSYYILSCQPPEDKNNKYVRFSDAADAIDFVARKLATLPSYLPDTQLYQKVRSSGKSAKDASKDWVAGISNPYNWNPQKYTTTIVRIMNNPVSPSDNISEGENLYRLSEGIQPATKPSVSNGPAATEALIQARSIFSAKLRWRNGKCDVADERFPRWHGYPVQRCQYTESGVITRTYMLNPTAEQLSRWTVTACEDAEAVNSKECIKAVSNQILTASSGIFPVSGFIPEPASSGGGNGDQIMCYLFRDGVTVNTVSVPKAPAASNGQCPNFDEHTIVTKARKFARVASTTRAQYKANGGQAAVGTDQDSDPRWLDVVRSLYQQAWRSDRNELISAKAKEMRIQKIFK